MHADAEAVRFRAKNDGVRAFGHAEFLQARFQVFPGFKPLLFRATLWLRLVGAQENMAAESAYAQGVSFAFQLFLQIVHHRSRGSVELFVTTGNNFACASRCTILTR